MTLQEKAIGLLMCFILAFLYFIGRALWVRDAELAMAWGAATIAAVTLLLHMVNHVVQK